MNKSYVGAVIPFVNQKLHRSNPLSCNCSLNIVTLCLFLYVCFLAVGLYHVPQNQEGNVFCRCSKSTLDLMSQQAASRLFTKLFSDHNAKRSWLRELV